ncbi:hypothetical protein OIV83_002412 [Microbotryomycetes sp. JL201]|nr:hypothetical protein OIV83_002412 [Microbotryomycetes sp. JL201]
MHNSVEPFTSLKLLLKAEKEQASRICVSKVGWWRDAKRWKGSAFPRVWRAVVIITIWSVVVATLDLALGKNLRLTNNVTPLLSVVVGLLLVFRNGAAYARWDEGRKAFGSMISTVRSLSRSTWINVGAAGPVRPASNFANNLKVSAADHGAKIKALRLMVAFPAAVKHHVRGEYGTDYEDLRALLSPELRQRAQAVGFIDKHLPTESVRTPTTADGPKPLRSAPLSIRQEIDSIDPEAALFSTPTTEERTPLLPRDADGKLQQYLARPSLALPLFIAHELSLYFATCKKLGLLESIGPAGYNALQQSVTSLVDQFTIIERLATIGIPTTYLIHLKQCVSVFLMTLPLVLVDTMGYAMVPFVSICAFTLMGIEGIASEIEMPFGVDESDLPLSLFCTELHNEIEHMTMHLVANSEEWSL